MLRPALPRRLKHCGNSAEGRIAIRRIEGRRRRRRDRKALGLDVVVGISGIDERLASRARQTIGKGPRIAAVQSLGIPVRAERSSKGHAVTRLVDGAQLPAIRDPCCGSRKRFGGGNLPSAIDHQGPADIEVGQASYRLQIVPGQARDRIREFVACQVDEPVSMLLPQVKEP